MTAQMEEFISEISDMDNTQLRALVITMKKDQIAKDAHILETEKMLTEMAKSYSKLKASNDQKDSELKKLRKDLNSVCEQLGLDANQRFGRKTEKLDDLLSKKICGDDPVSDFADEDSSNDAEVEVITDGTVNAGTKRNRSVGRSVKKQPSSTDTSKLPVIENYEIHSDEIDEECDGGSWRIVSWMCHESVEITKATAYLLRTYTPKISYNHGDNMKCIPAPNIVLPRTLLSSSLGALILYYKAALYLPIYRQVEEFSRYGFKVSRQVLNSWYITMAETILYPVEQHMEKLLLDQPCHQCDETTLTVIKDGRAPGSKSYVWYHGTSELYDGHKINIFKYCKTRSTDHLREFYQNFAGIITSDGYISYALLEKENPDNIVSSACFAHTRRCFAEALEVMKSPAITAEKINDSEEKKALMLIQDIYACDTSLKDVDLDEREEKRRTAVLPKVEALFDYLHSLDLNSDDLSARMKKAVSYAVNLETKLKIFLKNGYVPIDNNHSENLIRHIALGRRNWLFSTSIAGAEANLVVYSVVETAKANGADAYIYLKYLLDKVPKHLDDSSTEFLNDMLPWSHAYLEYQTKEKEIRCCEYSEKPDSRGRPKPKPESNSIAS